MDLSEDMVVTSQDGVHGTIIESTELRGSDTTHVLVRFDNEQEILVPAEMLTKRDDGTYSLPLMLGELEFPETGTQGKSEPLVIPIARETIDVQKRVLEKSRVRFTKVIHEHDELVDVPLLEEEIEVKRVPVNRSIDAPVPVRHEGNTLIVPLLKEVLVVQKQLILHEELHITRVQKQAQRPEHVKLRSEEIVVERLEPHDMPVQAGSEPDLEEMQERAV